ncbi:hypothetical protein HOK51_10450 [Candidatus Woesearchaeota archaeon]|jgi:hypothetical protein|nr:hypothetical protein [Candidatus Woesearchaeota archaeon]MBT6520242.1 hypothetical protein [Candidatus Woesearchaeota archaeon]MBT7367253.1 hypothetical protein [Candidatus Woesearchaeota archaeon]
MPAVDYKSKVLQLISIKGPVIPSQINRELEVNVIFASAFLSELVDNKVLRLSNLKFGGSPIYFKPGQEHMLQNFAHKLNEKDKKTFDLLKQSQVLRDKDQTPLVRVSLRGIKDFAVPLEVSHNNATDLFWKWYLLPNSEASSKIKSVLGIKDENEEKSVEVEKAEDVMPTSNSVSPKPIESKSKEESKKLEKSEDKAVEVSKKEDSVQNKFQHQTQQKLDDSLKDKNPEAKKIEELSIESKKKELEEVEERINSQRKFLESEQSNFEKQSQSLSIEKDQLESLRKELLDIRKEIKQGFNSNNSSEKNKSGKSRKEELEETKPEPPKKEFPSCDFSNQIKSFTEKNQIEILDFDLVRKNSELDLIINVPSPVGSVVFYCKAKSKKSISDGDLSSAFVQGQFKKLPVLFLSSGSITKKAEAMLSNEFKGMVFKNL